MAKNCRGKKKEQETRKCFKCNKEEYIAKDCKRKQMMKNKKVKEDLNNEDNKKEEDFGNNLK